MTSTELRTKFLDFFKSKGHTIIPSASVVPANDSTVLFTTAGMQPLVPYFLGEKHPGGNRIANVQKCIRTTDIEEVGDDTHLTFFEMLGNWSFGDYFKNEAIEWSWEFLTDKKWLGIDPNRLAVSVFAGDQDAPRDKESAEIWKSLGVPKERIAYLPKEDNWWGPAGQTGPCGPDTEIFYWKEGSIEAPKTFYPKDKRWVEIWNDVFMQYNKTAEGKFETLKQKNVDTGMGLDRVVAVLGGHSSVYDTELFEPLWKVIGLSQEIMTNDEVRRARVVLDHVRASVFIASDGVEPSNKDRGYVLRRLLRRAMVYGRLLNLKPHWLKSLIGKVISSYAGNYPELVEGSERIFKVIEDEEGKFGTTLERGLKEFEKLLHSFPPHDLFDITQGHLERKSKGEEGVGEVLAKSDKTRESTMTPSRSTPAYRQAGSRGGERLSGKEAFDLYQSYGFPWELTKELAETAGQKIDQEEFEEEFKKHQVLSRTASVGKFKGGLADHTQEVVRLHTATHLLNAALREVLGDHVWQKGSNITRERTRFDFTHPKKMMDEEKQKVEDLVNVWIKADLGVKKEIMNLSDAQKLGAIGVFGEKYPEQVSIYSVYDPKTEEVISREFCGGPHVEHTGAIGTFKIAKEEASSAGVRRIKAILENPKS